MIDKVTVKSLTKVVVNQVLGKLSARFAFFALGPVNAIAGIFLGIMVEYIIENSIMRVMFFMIDFKEDKKVKEFDDALQKAKDAQKKGEGLKEAEENLTRAARDLISFN